MRSEDCEPQTGCCNGLYLSMVCMGICTLFPYNSLLTGASYFDQKVYPGLRFPFSSMLAYSIPLCVMQVYLTFRGGLYSVSGRIKLGFLLCFLTLFVLVYISWQAGKWTYVPCLVTVSTLSVGNALLQSGSFGIAGAMGQEMSQAVMLGLGIAGLLSLGISLVGSAAEKVAKLNQDTQEGGSLISIALFSGCIVFTIFCCWVFFSHLSRKNQKAMGTLQSLERQRELRLVGGEAAVPRRSSQSRPASGAPSPGSEEKGKQGSQIELSRQETGILDTESAAEPDNLLAQVRSVLREVMPQAINVWLVFLVTMTIFPGVLTQWKPGPDSWFVNQTQLFSSLLVGAFQVFDVVGRLLAPCLTKLIPDKQLLWWVLLRIIFIPLFIFGQRFRSSSWVWGSDIGRFALSSSMAVTNGLLASLAMMYGPQLTAPPKREAAGIAMSCVMVTGIFAGTVVAFATQVGV